MTPAESLTDDELRRLSLAELHEVKAAVLSAVLLIEGQIADRGDAAKMLPYAPDGVPPERVWLRTAKSALSHKRAFLVRLKPLIHARTEAEKVRPTLKRTAYSVLEDLRAALAAYTFDGDEDAAVRGLLLEADAIIALRHGRLAETA